MYRHLFHGPWSDKMDKYPLTELAQRGAIKKFRKNQLLDMYSDDWAFAIIIKGEVNIYLLSSEGQMKIIYTAFAGAAIGVENLFSDGIFQLQARVKETAEISFIDQNTFNEILERDSCFYQYLIHQMVERNRMLILQQASMVFNNQRGYIAECLLQMASASDDFMISEDNSRLPVVFNQTELAAKIGCRRQAVNQILNEFLQEGLIGFQEKYIVIKNIEGLSKYVVGLL